MDAVDYGRKRDAARGMGLRIEENFGMQDMVGFRALQIRPGHVEEILLSQQHAGAGVVDIEEGLQIRKRVSAPQFIHRRIFKCHTIAFSQRKNQFGLERTFDVNVQFCLGHFLHDTA